MDKTININISGTLFKIDEDAFGILKDYLQAITRNFGKVPGGSETIEDIEARIAEIFSSQKGVAGVITRENVESMIATIGKPEDLGFRDDEPFPESGPEINRRMYRNPDDTIISGLCGGIGAYLNTDPVLFRILFILFTVFYGIGLLVYLALWISLPPANTEARKRELYGRTVIYSGRPAPQSARSRVGNAINEVFRAIGRVLYLSLRIFLIIIGAVLVITGFLFLVTLVMIFIFKYPGSFSTEAFDLNLANIPVFLSYIVSPGVAPWIVILSLAAVIIPLLAFIYLGVKMIFWFRAKDGVYLLAGLVVWVISSAALSIILFNEGISFAEKGRITSNQVISPAPATVYLKAGKKVSQLEYDKELMLRDECYNVFINGKDHELYIKPLLNINESGESQMKLEIKKRCMGRTVTEARKKAEELSYDYRISGDTLVLDEYFTIPAGRKWSSDNIFINMYIPEGTIIKVDDEAQALLRRQVLGGCNGEEIAAGASGEKSWILTKDGLKQQI